MYSIVLLIAHTEMNTYSNENFTFLIVMIHFNMHLFECIERLSNFYVTSLVLKKRNVYENSSSFSLQTVLIPL